MSSDADRAKQAHQKDGDAWRKEQERKYGPNWYQANRDEQKAEANNARNNQATKLIDYGRRWDSTDPYIILGVREVSTFSEIKNQYKFLSKKYHPDVATGANSDAIMKKINWVWDEIKIYKKTTKQDKFSSFLIYFNGLIIDYNRSIIRLYAEFHENGS